MVTRAEVAAMAERLLKGMTEKARAELELEGSMILEGVDVDITFGDPISPEPYVRDWAEIINSGELYLEKYAWEKAFNPGKAALQLGRLYTRAIMGMTTVNLDHILATLLAVTWRRSISEKTFRQRAWQAIENLRELEKYRLHSSLREDQLHLLADDDFDRYHSFITMAEDSGYISLRNRRIIINRGRFRRAAGSGNTRKDDIIHVLRGELRPFSGIDRELFRRSLTPGFIQRRKVRRHYLDLEISTFLEDYDLWARADTKPVNIGRPFLLKKPFQRSGVILVHGYMAAPEEMRPLAMEIHRAGYAVYVARLRGHGTSPADLNSRLWSEWYDSVNRACAIMESSVKRLAIIGFSTGAGITLLQAARKDGRFRCAVSVSAPLKLMNRKSRFSPALVAWNNILERFRLRKGRVEYLENHPENPDINYTQNPVHGVQELVRLMDQVRKKLRDISIPVLVLQGSHDPVVDPESAEAIYDGIPAGGKKILYIDSQRHGIVRGDTLKEVSEQIIRFLGKNF
jgi:esterase/lipase